MPPEGQARTKKQTKQLRVWKGRVELAKRFQKKHGNTDGRWDKNIRAMAGDFNSRSELGVDAIDVNVTYSTLRTVLPPMWLTEPHITVKPTRERVKIGRREVNNIERAELTETEINYWIRELEVRRQIRKAMYDLEGTNHCYLYIGFAQKRDVKVDDEHIENVPTIRAGQPFVRRHSPRRIFIPPGYEDLEDAPWVDIVFHRSLAHVKAKYGSRAGDVKPTSHLKTDSDDMQPKEDALRELEDNDEESGMVEVHQVWSKPDRKVYIWADGEDDFLEDPKPWPYELEGFPLAHEKSVEIPDEYHGTPPMSYAMGQQKELNATRTAMRKRRSRTKAVTWMDAEMAKEVAEVYANADDGKIIPLDLAGEDIRSKLWVDNGLPFDQGDLAYDAVVKRDYQEIQGLGAEQRGVGDPNIDSATASANVEKHTQVRQGDRADRVKGLYLQIAKKLWMILYQQRGAEVTRMREQIIGSRARAFREVTYKLADLEGEFGFDLDMGSMLADTPQTRELRAQNRYLTFRQDPLVNPQELILDVLKAQNHPSPQRLLVFLRSPQEEIERMMQGLPTEPHERDDHEAHMQQHDAQSDQLDDALQQLQSQPPSSEEGQARMLKVQLTQALLLAHQNAHAQMLQQIAGVAPQAPGSPTDTNQLRNNMAVGSGQQTEAEMRGEPMNQVQ